MVNGVGSFANSYFSPFSKNESVASKALNGLKIASYFTLVIPLAVALVWGGSALAGRVSNFFSKSNATAQKADDLASKILSPNKRTNKGKVEIQQYFSSKEQHKQFLDDTIIGMKSLVTFGDLEKSSDVLFDSSSMPEGGVEFMKGIKLGEIKFEESEKEGKFKIVNKANPSEYLEFSNRSSSRGEPRGKILQENLEAMLKEAGGEDRTLHSAITEMLTPGIGSPFYLAYKQPTAHNYPGISEEKIDAFASKVLDALIRGEGVDEERAAQMLQDVLR